MGACKCNVSLGNTGRPGCEPIFSVARTLIVVKRFADDGTKNQIDLSATLNQAYFTGKVNHADDSKRWFPIKEFKNVTSEKAESVFEEFEDTSKIKIREGLRSMSGILPKISPNYLSKIKGYECAEIGIFIIDKDGNLLGSQEESGYLDPILVDSPSWNVFLIFGTDTTVQKIQLDFDWSVDQKDENLRMITAADVNPVNLLSLDGLIDVSSTISDESTTSFKAKLTTDFGSVIDPVVVKGLVAGDFALYNVTDASAVTISSVTESPEGTYEFTFAAQTSADILRLTPTKNGYDFTNVVATTITIP